MRNEGYMKINKTLTITSLAFLTLINTHAALEQVWQVDLSPYLGDYVVDNYDYPIVFSDDNAGLLLTHGSISTNHLLLVVNALDGSRLAHGEFTADSVYTIEKGGPSTRIVVHGSKESESAIMCFERSETNLVKVGEIIGIPARNEQPCNTHLVYALKNTTLSKYKFTGTEPIIQKAEMGIEGNNFVISWDSEAGVEYQVQHSLNLTNWINTGTSLSGTGDTMSWANQNTNNSCYYRLVVE